MKTNSRFLRALRWTARVGLIEAVFGLAFAAQVFYYERDITPTWAFWLELGVCLAAAVSGRWPRQVAAVVAVAFLFLSWMPTDAARFSMVPAWVILTSLGARGHTRWASVAAVVYLVEVGVIEAGSRGSTVDFWSVLRWMAYWSFFVALFWGLGFWLNRVRRDRRRLIAERDEAIRSQRQELARDLHDTLGSSVTKMLMRAQEVRLREPADSALRQDLDVIIAAGNEAIRDVRALMGALRREAAAEQVGAATAPAKGVREALEQLTGELEASGFTVHVLVEGEPDQLSGSLTRTLVKVLDEAALNVRKHGAPGSTCEVMLAVGESEVEVVVTNVRGGHQVRQANHVGLIGLRERVETLGGELTSSVDSERHVLQVSLPLRLVEA